MLHACAGLWAARQPAAAARLSAAWRVAAAALAAAQQPAAPAATAAAGNRSQARHIAAAQPRAEGVQQQQQQPALSMLRRSSSPLLQQPAPPTAAHSSHRPHLSQRTSSSSGSSSSSSRQPPTYQLDPIHTASCSATAATSTSRTVPQQQQQPQRRGVVAVALSGGVDSAVAALLLKAAGHELFGVFMHNWDAADEAGVSPPACTAAADLADAKAVAAALGIPLYEADFVSTYWNGVFEGFLEGLQAGLTPNPDVACNSIIKFGALLAFARERGADLLATGHYARLGWVEAGPGGSSGSGEGPVPLLLTGADAAKDQSYFLAGLNQQQLAAALFPVGHLSKPLVRRLAADAGLAPAAKRSSAGICFIGRRSFGRFLESYLPPRPGLYVDADTGRALGPCSNMLAVTVGQRAPGLGGQGGRVYVAGKDLAAGQVAVVSGHDHPALFSRRVLLRQPSWVAGAAPYNNQSDGGGGGGGDSSAVALHYKARYRQPPGECRVGPLHPQEPFHASRLCQAAAQQQQQGGEGGSMVVAELAQPLRGVAPGQAFVMYDGEACLGSAVIAAHGPTLQEEQQQLGMSE